MSGILSKISLSALIFMSTAILLLGNAVFRLKTIAGQDTEIEAIEARVNELRTDVKGRTGNDDDAEAFRKSLPAGDELAGVLRKVFSIAAKNGLSIKAGDYSPGAIKDAGIPKYSFSFPVEGRYAQLKKFIYDVEGIEVPLVIEEMALTGHKSDEGMISLKMKITLYFS